METGSGDACIFCKIVRGDIPSPRIFEDENVICIRDIRPQAKIHLLIVSKRHVSSLDSVFPESGEEKGELISKMFAAAVRVARENRLLPGGFRSIINTGHEGGQTVFHLHLHLLGGEMLHEAMV